jgi:CRP-like cAMP-binding protein
MEVQQLNKAIDKFSSNVIQKSRIAFTALCVEKTFSHARILLKPQQSYQSEYILLDGIARTFLLNTQGEEITLSFFKENTVLPPYITRTENKKSLLYCEALTDCTFAKIDAKAFETLMIENLEIREFGNSVLRQELVNKVQKEIRMASWTAK